MNLSAIIKGIINLIKGFLNKNDRQAKGNSLIEMRTYNSSGDSILKCLIMGISDADIPVITTLEYGCHPQEGSFDNIDIIYIGGSDHSPLTRILESTSRGVPVIFGPEISRTDIAYEIMALGGGLMADTPATLQHILQRLSHNPEEMAQRSRYISEWHEYYQTSHSI